MLGRWQNARAQLRELTVSHKSLIILLTHDGQGGNLVLSCVDPFSIKARITWENSELTVSSTQLPDLSEGFLVCDRRADVEILCNSIEIRENVRLY